MNITFEQVLENKEIHTYIEQSDSVLLSMGYTEHSFPHVMRVAELSQKILATLNYPKRDCELACIAAYMHDIGNMINRHNHAQNGALLAFDLLKQMHADPNDIALIMTAIGNHDEGTAFPVDPITAALILADKSDVRYTRVRNQDFATFDIHDRVNYAVKRSDLYIEKDSHIELDLDIDTSICAVMDYFEIFLERMMLCRKAAEKLGLAFRLTINKQPII